MSTDDLILQLAERLKHLAEHVESVAPYVQATLPRTPTRDCNSGHGKWGEAHMGRSFSSRNQLNILRGEAKEALAFVEEIVG